jgi:hypothetical protein
MENVTEFNSGTAFEENCIAKFSDNINIYQFKVYSSSYCLLQITL